MFRTYLTERDTCYSCATKCKRVVEMDGGTGKKVCTPGSYVFCRCAGGEDATKLCNEDGETFGPCELGENRPCTETPDPNTGDAAVPQPGDAAIPPTPASEACDGQNIALNPNQEITVSSDTKPAKDDAKGQNACAGGAGAPDHVYALTVPATGRLTGPLASRATTSSPWILADSSALLRLRVLLRPTKTWRKLSKSYRSSA